MKTHHVSLSFRLLLPGLLLLNLTACEREQVTPSIDSLPRSSPQFAAPDSAVAPSIQSDRFHIGESLPASAKPIQPSNPVVTGKQLNKPGEL